MEQIIKFFKKKGLGYYLTPFALGLGIAALVIYCQTGVTSFSISLSTKCIVFSCIGIALCALGLVFDFRELRYLAFLSYLYAFLWFIDSQVNYIANVFVSIDGYGFTAGFLGAAICFVLALAFALAAGILTGRKLFREKGVSL